MAWRGPEQHGRLPAPPGQTGLPSPGVRSKASRRSQVADTALTFTQRLRDLQPAGTRPPSS